MLRGCRAPCELAPLYSAGYPCSQLQRQQRSHELSSNTRHASLRGPLPLFRDLLGWTPLLPRPGLVSSAPGSPAAIAVITPMRSLLASTLQPLQVPQGSPPAPLLPHSPTWRLHLGVPLQHRWLHGASALHVHLHVLGQLQMEVSCAFPQLSKTDKLIFL